MPVEKWKSISADGAPPGVFTSNMSDDDKLRWKARLVGSKSGDHEIEIRSQKPMANLVAVVNGTMPGYDPKAPLSWTGKPGQIKLSANGPMYFDPDVWADFTRAVHEARQVLVLLDDPSTRDRALNAIREGRHPLETP